MNVIKSRMTRKCTCGTQLVKGQNILTIGSVKLCHNCIELAIDGVSNKTYPHIRSNFFIAVAQRKCYCKECGHTFVRGDFLARAFQAQAFSASYCLDCLHKCLELLDKAQVEPETLLDIERLLLEARYGKDAVRFYRGDVK